MTKTPPNRRGITFEVGSPLEARDSLKNWYAASIEKIDYDDEKVLIHYRQWSHRYDEWFDWSSPYLRPVERIQLRREGLQENSPVPVKTSKYDGQFSHSLSCQLSKGFHVNDKVLASWSDCRFYPAKVLAVNKDASYTVKFFDGVIQTVKGIHVKPFYKERGGRNKPQDRNREKHPVTREQNGKDRKPLENGRGIQENGRSQRDKNGTSCQDTESDTEEEEDNEQKEDGSKLKVAKNTSTEDVQVEHRKGVTEEEEQRKMERTKNQETEREDTKPDKDLIAEESKVKEEVGGESGRRRSRERSGTMETSSKAEPEEMNGVKVEESEPAGGESQSGGEQQSSSKLLGVDMKEEGGSEPAARPGTEEGGESSKEGPSQTRRTRGRLTEGGRGEKLRDVIELRKRKICLGQTTPTKKSKPDTSTDRNSSAESRPTAIPSNQKQSEPDSTPTPSVVASNDKEAQGATVLTENPKPVVDESQLSPALQAVLRRQVHLPTTNKYSREPLYRVIKNQPPPILSIELDHNPFKCKAPGCLKSFRKAKLLHYHMKYYHEDKASESDLSPTRSIQTRASEKQAAHECPKRRRTISASMHSSLHSAHRALNSPRGDGKATRLNEKRRTSAPPAVNAAEQQRPLLREKSKENQLERSRRPLEKERDRDRSMAETVAKEREKLKEKKHRDFLRIKLKKKKKKKKKSKSEYTGSEENIDISVFNVQTKLNLLHKFPLSHKHKSYNSSPGYNTEQIQVDDEDSVSDWSTDSPVWSEDELGVELDVTTPPQEQGVSMATQGFEIVRCVCEVQEENDFMIQCEECLCWQHGTCMGLLEENVPERYTCYICRDPPGQRRSLRYWYDRDWLSSGHMYGLPFLEENYSHQNAKKIAATHQLLGDVHRVIEVLNGLQLKMSILQTQAHPDLKLWCQPWKQAEKPRKRGGADTGAMPSPATDEGEERERERGGGCGVGEAAEKQPSRVPSFQDSYISSEHCYQKPRTYYPAVEQRLVVETRGSELEDSLRSTEDLLELEQRYGGPLDPDRGKIHLQLDRPLHNKEADCYKKLSVEHSYEIKSEDSDLGDKTSTDSSLQQQWQINLLDHIEAMQDEVTHRMDFIERELDVLESWLDYTGELEPPEPLARLPQLKHRIKQLLTELGKVQQIALCCST
ncbi:PHD finger protein 20b isoform X2 [Conger conger]|uniref:PHD finger protein 20b isoform X2 n=1 Tax=Conger conger TaxID=82655 RepID=UPI002A59B1DB|nr:PHD finger protein 20b isoform X2 [Conger conger]